MRVRFRVLAVLEMLAVLLSATPAAATHPIDEPRRPEPIAAAADTGVERLARSASSLCTSTIATGLVAGVTCMVAGIHTNSGGVFLTGMGAWGAAVVFGPTLGWDRAGYPGRGSLGAVARLAVLAAAIALPIADLKHRESDVGGPAVIAGGTTALAVLTVQACFEGTRIAPYVRAHGPGRAMHAQLEPTTTPSGAVGLALVAHFR